MKRPSYLTLATALASIVFLTSACTHSSDSTTTDTSGAGAAATAAAGSQGAMGSGGPMSGGGAMSGGGGGRGGAGRMMGKILLSLNLTDAQKAQIKALRTDFQAKNKGLARNDPARLANMKAYYAQIDTVLTPAQRVTFHTKLDAMRAKFRQQQGQVQQPSQQSSP